MKVALKEGDVYRHDYLTSGLEGGFPRFYLPFKGQRVFAAFLTPKLNPDAPDVVLVGRDPNVERAGVIFSRQQTPVPTFIKKATNQWEYRGRYRVAEVVERGEASRLQGRHHRVGHRRPFFLANQVGSMKILLPTASSP